MHKRRRYKHRGTCTHCVFHKYHDSVQPVAKSMEAEHYGDEGERVVMEAWERLRRYLTDLEYWLSRQNPASVAQSALTPHEQALERLSNWFAQLPESPNKRDWVNWISRVQRLAESRRCRGFEILGVCHQA